MIFKVFVVVERLHNFSFFFFGFKIFKFFCEVVA